MKARNSKEASWTTFNNHPCILCVLCSLMRDVLASSKRRNSAISAVPRHLFVRASHTPASKRSPPSLAVGRNSPPVFPILRPPVHLRSVIIHSLGCRVVSISHTTGSCSVRTLRLKVDSPLDARLLLESRLLSWRRYRHQSPGRGRPLGERRVRHLYFSIIMSPIPVCTDPFK
jgi:hypothetical protein